METILPGHKLLGANRGEAEAAWPPAKTVGVIGGLGPLATVEFLQRLYEGRSVASEQEFVRTLVDCNPRIPSRDAMSESVRRTVGGLLSAMAAHLHEAGAELIVMPCNTAHVFEEEIRRASSCPFLSIIDVAVRAACDAANGTGGIGLLATDTCLEAGLYQRRIHAQGLEPLTLDSSNQQLFMELVRAIKRGDKSAEIGISVTMLANGLFRRGAEVVIAACTEIPLVIAPAALDGPLIDSLGVLADRTWDMARGAQPDVNSIKVGS